MCGLVQALSKLILNELWPTSTRLGGAGREWKMVQMMASTREVKEKLALLVQDGTMKVVIDSVWDFEDPFPGYDIVGKGRARGKVVVRIDA
jgi:NADPH:quinone reductase-like Zn-dependent oxidoreductase